MGGWPSARDWIFSAKAFVASMLALFIGLYLDLPRPYWAMATVYVVAHPLTGATRSKSVYRVLGTLLGATASVLFVAALVNTPALLMAAVAVWVAVLLYVALLDRTPRSYLFMLAAYTLPLIALPAVDHPQGVFDLAVARSEEICLGILCASVVGAVLFPVRVSDVLHDRLASWMGDAAQWVGDMLSPGAGAALSRHHSRHRLAADILALDQLISQLSYDTETAARIRDAKELRGRMTMLLPVMSSLASLVETMQRDEAGVPPELAARMAVVSDWISDASGPAPMPDDGAALSFDTALTATVHDRLRELTALWQDCVTLQRRLGNAESGGEWKPVFRRWSVREARHYDHGMLLFSTVTTALAIFCMGMIWIWTGWADGAGAVTLGAVACCFFAALDEPAPMIRSFFTWNVVCMVLAMVYLFMILPLAHDFELLVAMFAIPFLLFGVMIVQPRLNLVAMLLTTVMASEIGLQASYNADFHSFFNGNVAGVAGILFALIWTLLVRPFGTAAAVRRLVRASWGDIARNASGRDPREHDRLRARMLDRLAQLVPRLAASESEQSPDGFTEVRVELSTLALQRELPALPAERRHAVRRVLRSVARYYRDKLEARVQAPPPALRLRLARAIQGVADRSDQPSRTALAALIEIEVALFSTSPMSGRQR